MEDMIKINKESSFSPPGRKQESKALADAMRALHQKIRDLEIEKDNLENHVRYLQETRNHSETIPNSYAIFTESDEELQKMREIVLKLEQDKLLLCDNADFFEKELKRKQEQFNIDRDTWEIEKKTLRKSLETIKLQSKFSRKAEKTAKPSKSLNKLEDTNLKLLEELKSLKTTSKLTESRLVEAEEIISHLKKEHYRKLQSLESEIHKIKVCPCVNCPKLQAEVDSLRGLCCSQNSRIESLNFEVATSKNYDKKIEGIENYINSLNKTEVQGLRESNYQGSIKDLEKDVNRLSKKYKSLLDRTRNIDENYPELRSELKQTALELEVQSFNLYQIRKLEQDDA